MGLLFGIWINHVNWPLEGGREGNKGMFGLAPTAAVAKARRENKKRGIKTKEETQGSSVRAPPRSPV